MGRKVSTVQDSISLASFLSLVLATVVGEQAISSHLVPIPQSCQGLLGCF